MDEAVGCGHTRLTAQQLLVSPPAHKREGAQNGERVALRGGPEAKRDLLDEFYDSQSGGTSSACASFAIVSGAPARRPLSRSDR